MKNSRSKKLLLVLITLSVLLPTFASCSEKPADETTADTTAPAAESDVSTISETETEADSEELLPDIPKLDFEGRTFTILTSGLNDTNGKDWITYDVYAESINDAVFERNEYLNSTYNIKARRVPDPEGHSLRAENRGHGEYRRVPGCNDPL